MVVDHREALPRPPEVGLARTEAEAGVPVGQRSLWKDAVYRFARNRAAVVAIVLFVIIVLYCVIVPFVSPYDPNEVAFARAYLPASLDHPFGTDKFGRDLFTRVAVGGRISIAIGFAGTLVILAIGLVYGSLAGFLGGRVDTILMRFLDALYGLPYLPFAIITTQVLSPDGTATFWTMVAALTIASWLTTARIVRGQIVTLKQNDYVLAAKAVGARWHRVLARHLVPNTFGILIIAVFLDLPAVVLGEAFLSFIGLGINPPTASWGSIAQDGRAAYVIHPLVIIVPSLMIATLVLCSNSSRTGCVTHSIRARAPKALEAADPPWFSRVR